VILGAFLLTALSLSGLVALAAQSRQAQLALAEEGVVHLAAQIAESLSSTLVVADMSLDDVLWGMREKQPESMRADMDRAVASVPDIRSLALFDDKGELVATDRAREGLLDRAGVLEPAWLKMVYRAHRDEWRDPMVWVLDGGWSNGPGLALTRGGWSGDGTFLGVGLAIIDLSRLRETLQADPKANHVKVTATVGDRKLELLGALADNQPRDVWLDDNTLSRLGRAGRGEMPEAGRVMERAVVGQVLARDFPLRVFIQLPVEKALAGWNGEVRVLFLVGSALALAVFGFLVLYMRQERARSRAEDRLEREETRLKMALRNGRYGLFDWRVTSGYVYFSHENMHLLGEEPGSWAPNYASWESRLHPEDRDRTLSILQAHLAGNSERYDARFRMRAADGTWRWFHALGVVVERDSAGRPLRMVGTQGDVTDDMAAQAALEEKSRRLEESNRDLEQFAYVASHDLREPLRMVSNYLGLIRRRHADLIEGEVGEFMAFAEDGAKRMARLVNDLLDYSRVSSHALPVESLSLRSVIDDAMGNLTLPLRDSQAEVVLPDGDPRILGDRGQLVRVFQNLIGNALKYRALDRPCKVVVDHVAAGGRVEVSVSDNGIGFRQEDAERIFLIFQRLHGPGEYEGTGIGLAICRRIVERHGGRIEARGMPGEGSVFRFTLPMVVPARDAGYLSQADQVARWP
jgi:signal transduction histidine kinase